MAGSVRPAAAMIFEVGSILASVLLGFYFKSESRVMVLLFVSLAQASTLEYLFYRRGKYRYSRELFHLVVPGLDIPPLAIIMGYFWFYFAAFYISELVVVRLGVASPTVVVSIFLLCSFLVEYTVDGFLVSLGLYKYATKSKGVWRVPMGALSTVTCVMALSLYLAYYSDFLLGAMWLPLKIVGLVGVGVLGGVGLGLMRGVLPGSSLSQAILLPLLFLLMASLFSHLVGL